MGCGGEGRNGSAISGKCFSCTKGQRGLPTPPVTVLTWAVATCPTATLPSALHSHPFADKCIAPAYGVHASHPHCAHSHPAHTSHKFTNTPCTSVPSLLLGVVPGLSSTPLGEKLKIKCHLLVSLAYQQTVQWDKEN